MYSFVELADVDNRMPYRDDVEVDGGMSSFDARWEEMMIPETVMTMRTMIDGGNDVILLPLFLLLLLPFLSGRNSRDSRRFTSLSSLP
jgi:hypothetical protein